MKIENIYKCGYSIFFFTPIGGLHVCLVRYTPLGSLLLSTRAHGAPPLLPRGTINQLLDRPVYQSYDADILA